MLRKVSLVKEATGKRIADYFDLIASTSTGGIIALGLGLGLSAKDILRFYQENGRRVLGQETDGTGLCSRISSFWRKQERRVRQCVGPAYDPLALKAASAEFMLQLFAEEMSTPSAGPRAALLPIG